MVKDNLKYFAFSFAIVIAVSFFFSGSLPCLAYNLYIYENALTNDRYGNTIDLGPTYDGTSWHAGINYVTINGTDAGALFTGFTNPIEHWHDIDTLYMDICTDGDPENNDDQAADYSIGLQYAKTVNDCHDFEADKCVMRVSMHNHHLSSCGSESHYTDADLNNGNPLLPTDLTCDFSQGNYFTTDTPVLCGFYISNNYYPTDYPTFVGRQYIRTISSENSIGYVWNPDNPTGTSTYGAWFELYADQAYTPPPDQQTSDPCDCAISTSTSWVDIGVSVISCGLKSTMCWAFYPDAGTIQNFATSTAILSEKFPLNTFFGLTGAVADAMDTSDSDRGGSLGVPMARTVNGHEQTYILTVISSSTMPKAIGSANTTLFRNGLVWLGWLITAGLIFIIIFTL